MAVPAFAIPVPAIALAIVIWLLLAYAVAQYGENKGFAFAPLFIATLFLGFPLVLLGIALAAGLRPKEDAPTGNGLHPTLSPGEATLIETIRKSL